MGYRHINNLYKSQEVLMFKECYVSEKIHGTSAHIGWDVENTKKVKFFSGGSSHLMFTSLFDQKALTNMHKGKNHQCIKQKW